MIVGFRTHQGWGSRLTGPRYLQYVDGSGEVSAVAHSHQPVHGRFPGVKGLAHAAEYLPQARGLGSLNPQGMIT
jgi:hypothetical protein